MTVDDTDMATPFCPWRATGMRASTVATLGGSSGTRRLLVVVIMVMVVVVTATVTVALVVVVMVAMVFAACSVSKYVPVRCIQSVMYAGG